MLNSNYKVVIVYLKINIGEVRLLSILVDNSLH